MKQRLFWFFVVLLGMIMMTSGMTSVWAQDGWDRVSKSKTLAFGSDEEGGAPFLFRNEQNDLVGFEWDLIQAIGRELGDVKPEFHQAQWDTLLSVLQRGDVDIVMNGYEKTSDRDARYLSTRPYYVYQVQLMARKDSAVRSWADLEFERPGGTRWKVGVLTGSGAARYARANSDPKLVQVIDFDATTTALMATANGQLDATLQDLAPSQFYLRRDEFRELALAGPATGAGYYSIYVRRTDQTLKQELDKAIGKLIDSGDIKKIFEKHQIWNEAQEVLKAWSRDGQVIKTEKKLGFDWNKLFNFGPSLLWAALMTIFLASVSMPLAIVVGLLIALGRFYGPKPLGWILRAYVEVVRGTPLMLQLFVLFYLLPELNIYLPAIVAGILGLAINYSAYEAEIYRASLSSVPVGQMEAALSLGMSKRQAIRRIILPQTLRMALPPVTNDFIAMFKDTSVCSAITLVELTKQYSILYNTHGGVVEFGIAAGLLYMAMSLPLAQLSNRLEARMGGKKTGKVA